MSNRYCNKKIYSKNQALRSELIHAFSHSWEAFVGDKEMLSILESLHCLRSKD